MRKALAAILAFVVMLAPLLALAGTVSASPTSFDMGFRNIPMDSYSVLRSFTADGGSSVSYTVTVTPTSGTAHPIDVLLLDESNFFRYRDGLSFVDSSGSALSTTDAVENVSLTTGLTYYLVADNTNAPAGGATPVSEEHVFFSLVGTNVTLIGERVFDALIIAAIVIIVAIAVIVLLAIVFLVLRKPRQAPPAPPQASYAQGLATPPGPPVEGMKICPTCGFYMPQDARFCPRCGRSM